ncbi:MAG: DNA polymerase III subunit alpha [Ruminococcus sp.]|nr:DNA polymerase III subunit alpha [Ruminococcus sp.]
MTDFVHLHLHTEYSLLDGACPIKELVLRLKELGQQAAAITDHGNMFGAVEFYNACMENGIKPIIGCEVYVAPGSRHDRYGGNGQKPYHLILLCENNEGYKNLIKLVSLSYTEGFYNKPRVDLELLREYSRGLICLSACLAGEVPRKLSEGNYEGAKETALLYRDIFGEGNYFLEIQDHLSADEKRLDPLLIRLSRETGIPLCATNDCHYLRREDAEAQKVLMCISTQTTVDDPAIEFPTDEFYVKSAEEMEELFGALPGAVENTVRIAERCSVKIEFGNTVLPYIDIKGVTDHERFLRDMCYEGLERLYGTVTDELRERLEYELWVITSMGYTDYYLIVWDFINYAKSQGIPVGPGRGSGAASLCAYCIGITGIDPLRYQLVFERFLNPERQTMPDFDIDFCMEGRQQVIDYVVRKYGADHVAQIATFGTMGPKQAVRDAARAMGEPYRTGDILAKAVVRDKPLSYSVEHIPEARELYQGDPLMRRIINTAMKIEGLPRNVSTHAAGVVITKEPVDRYVPLYARDGAVSTQYTMTLLERLGLLKIDFLGLRNLTIIKHCVEEIHKTEPDFDIEKISLEDRAVYDMLSMGKTEGVFQFESGGMTSVIMRLRPTGIEDLIAAISLYRPGPMDSIGNYISCRHDPSRVRYKHPLLKDILEVTYGCIVYQEQVMQIFRTLAGYSFGRADLVRRAMSKKKAAALEAERQAFIYGDKECCGAVARGVPERVANELFDEMTAFANYAFNKAHAAAYATVSYRTAYLKCHYYRQYMAALMTNALLESTEKLYTYIADARKNRTQILPVDINRSERGFVAEGEGLRFGLLAVKSLGEGAIANILKERAASGEFRSLQDFCTRVNGRDIHGRTLEALIKSGAFDCFGFNRHTLLVNYENILSDVSASAADRLEGQLDFFSDLGEENTAKMDKPLHVVEELPVGQLLEYEHEVLGMYVSAHPLDEYEPYLKAARITGMERIAGAGEKAEGVRAAVLGMVTKKRDITTKKGAQMSFVTLEDKRGEIETVVFPSVFEKNAGLIRERQILHVWGKLSVKEDEEPKLMADDMETGEAFLKRLAGRELFVRIESAGSEKVPAVKDIVLRYADEEGVGLLIYIEDIKKKTAVRGAPRVRLCKELMEELSDCAGERNVVFSQKRG